MKEQKGSQFAVILNKRFCEVKELNGSSFAVILNERFCEVKDLGDPRGASRLWQRNNRAFGSLPY